MQLKSGKQISILLKSPRLRTSVWAVRSSNGPRTTLWFMDESKRGFCHWKIQQNGIIRYCKKKKTPESNYCRIHNPRLCPREVLEKQEELSRLKRLLRDERRNAQIRERRKEVDERR